MRKLYKVFKCATCTCHYIIIRKYAQLVLCGYYQTERLQLKHTVAISVNAT